MSADIVQVRFYGAPSLEIDAPEDSNGIQHMKDPSAYLSIRGIEALGRKVEIPYAAPLQQRGILRPIDVPFHPKVASRLLDYFEPQNNPAQPNSRETNCAGFMLNLLGSTSDTLILPDDKLAQSLAATEITDDSSIMPMTGYAFGSGRSFYHFAVGMGRDRILSVNGYNGPLLYGPAEIFRYGNGKMFELALPNNTSGLG